MTSSISISTLAYISDPARKNQFGFIYALSGPLHSKVFSILGSLCFYFYSIWLPSPQHGFLSAVWTQCVDDTKLILKSQVQISIQTRANSIAKSNEDNMQN